MSNLTLEQLQTKVKQLNEKRNTREVADIKHFDTDFTTEGLYSDKTEYGSRVGIHFLRDNKKQFIILNENLSTDTIKFTDMENIFLNLIGQFTDRCNLFSVIDTDNQYIYRMANCQDGFKFSTSHLHQMEKHKLFSRKQIFAILRGLEKKNVITLEWYIDNISKRLLWIHFTKEFLQERAYFETKQDAIDYAEASQEIQELSFAWLEKEEETKNV